jgi:hypothetical protein
LTTIPNSTSIPSRRSSRPTPVKGRDNHG